MTDKQKQIERLKNRQREITKEIKALRSDDAYCRILEEVGKLYGEDGYIEDLLWDSQEQVIEFDHIDPLAWQSRFERLFGEEDHD